MSNDLGDTVAARRHNIGDLFESSVTNPIFPMYGHGLGVLSLRDDGWPSVVSYCGATKCMEMLFGLNDTVDTNSAVVIGAFSNHKHWSFANQSAFEAYRPSEVITTPPDELIAKGDGATALVLAPADEPRTVGWEQQHLCWGMEGG